MRLQEDPVTLAHASVPAVFPDGRVCISILHAPGFDPLNPQESAAEKWSPVHTVSDRARHLSLLDLRVD